MLVISGYLDYFILKAEFQTKILSPSAKIAEYWINNMCEQPFWKSVRPTAVSLNDFIVFLDNENIWFDTRIKSLADILRKL